MLYLAKVLKFFGMMTPFVSTTLGGPITTGSAISLYGGKKVKEDEAIGASLMAGGVISSLSCSGMAVDYLDQKVDLTQEYIDSLTDEEMDVLLIGLMEKEKLQTEESNKNKSLLYHS